MKEVGDYRRNANECRELARRMPEQHRQQLLQMAEQWEELARKREVALAQGNEPQN